MRRSTKFTGKIAPKREASPSRLPVALLLVGAAGAGYAAGGVENFSDVKSSAVSIIRGGDSCSIKGNISIDTGERIYHVPGQKYYAVTKVSPQYGERWFCSESEARRAGWRRSKR